MTKPNQPLPSHSPVVAELIKALGIELRGMTELTLFIRPQELVTIRVRYLADTTAIEKVAEYILAERITAERVLDND
jgi:hypothetical protein